MQENFLGNLNQNLSAVLDRELSKVVPEKQNKWFGSVEYRPANLNFATQNEDEHIYVLVRTHWIKNIGWIVNNIIYSLLPIIVILTLDYFNISLGFIGFKVYLVLIIAYYSVIFTNVLRDFYDWYFDTYIVTNQRVLDYEFRPFTSYKVLEAYLESIEDVEESATGLTADMFHYGDLKIRTASTVGELTFDSIADPTVIRDILMDLVKVVKRYKNGN